MTAVARSALIDGCARVGEFSVMAAASAENAAVTPAVETPFQVSVVIGTTREI